MPNPQVSFVVPCYNYARYLPDCLSSIFGQRDHSDFEVIAIDDGSTDETSEVLQRFADPRLRVITHPVNQGHVATVNKGLAEARGAYVARIDPDDRYRPQFLNTVLAKFDAHPEVGLVYGDVAMINGHGEITAERCEEIHGGRDFKGRELLPLLEKNFICAPTTIARREVWQKVLPIPAGLAFNDWYLNVMMARECEFYYVHEVLADYRVHAANHHTKIILDRTDEASILRVLDAVFASPEKTVELENQKQRFRNRAYGSQYLTLADKYFGFDMNADSRRCYWQAIRHQPRYLLRPAVVRRWLATIFGRRPYEWSKRLVKSTFGLSTNPGR